MVMELRPHLILLDVMLPGMNGFEICRKIKSDPEISDTAVILLTVLSEVEDRTQGINVGADLFLSKPVDYKELKKQIEFFLSSKKRLQRMDNNVSICRCLLNIMRRLDRDLYERAVIAKRYGQKTAQMLQLSDEAVERTAIGSALYDFGRVLGEDEAHWHAAVQVLEPLKNFRDIAPYIQAGRVPHPDLEAADRMGLAVVEAVNRYLRLLESVGEEKEALVKLEEEMEGRSMQMPQLLHTLSQVIEDERFMEDLGKEG